MIYSRIGRALSMRVEVLVNLAVYRCQSFYGRTRSGANLLAIPRLGSYGVLTRSAHRNFPMAAPVTVCVGDIHGHLARLQRIWHNLENKLGVDVFASANVIFLGDFCDRGPDTAGVLDFLVGLPMRYPFQKHVFLCGNHDFGFSAFVGLFPTVPGFKFSETWEAFRGAEEEEGWWSGDGYEHIHVQGRRWAGKMRAKFNVKKGMDYRGSIYDSEPTFASYGVKHGDREGLIKAVPESHKLFLKSLVWIHEQEGVQVDDDDPQKSYSMLIAVHAGLEDTKPVEEQLKILKHKDIRIPKLEALSGRRNVWKTPDELVKNQVLLVSGHHCSVHIDSFRIILDESGGQDHLPLAAIVLPSRQLVRDTD